MQGRCEQLRLSRRALLVSVAASTSLLAGARSAEAAIKVPQGAVHYQPTPKDGQDCQHCYQFVAPNGCKFVDGDITPTGWCRLWVKKPA
jgi:hypothetical protein